MKDIVTPRKEKILFLDRVEFLGKLISEKEEDLGPLHTKLLFFLENGYEIKVDFLIHRVDRSDLTVRLKAVNLKKFWADEWSYPDYPVCDPLNLSVVGYLLGQVGLQYDHLKKTLESQPIDNVSIVVLNEIPSELAQRIFAS